MNKPVESYYSDRVVEERAILADAARLDFSLRGETITARAVPAGKFLIGEASAGHLFGKGRPVALVYGGDPKHRGKLAPLDPETLDAVLGECRDAGFSSPPVILHDIVLNGTPQGTGYPRDERFDCVAVTHLMLEKLRLHRRRHEIGIGFCQPKFYRPAVWARSKAVMDDLCANTPFVYREVLRGGGHYWQTDEARKLEAALLNRIPGPNRLQRALAAVSCACGLARQLARKSAREGGGPQIDRNDCKVKTVEEAVAIAESAYGDEQMYANQTANARERDLAASAPAGIGDYLPVAVTGSTGPQQAI